MTKISDKSVLRYPGGKSRACKILDSMLPENVNKVLSPFIGGGSFELFLTTKNIQVYGYDKFKTLSIFWEQLLSEPIKLGENIDKYRGEVDKDLFLILQKEIKEIEHGNKIAEDDLDVASKFFVVNRCSFSGITLSGGYSKSLKKRVMKHARVLVVNSL